MAASTPATTRAPSGTRPPPPPPPTPPPPPPPPPEGAPEPLGEASPETAEQRRANLLACEDLVRNYWDAMHRLAFKACKDADEAADIVQVVFIRIWRRRHIRPLTTIDQAYLMRSVRRGAWDAERRLRRAREALERYAADRRPYAPPQITVFDESSLIAVTVKQAMGEMPPACQAVMEAVRRGVSQVEVARVRGVSLGTVEKQVSKARKLIMLALLEAGAIDEPRAARLQRRSGGMAS
ncbi:MAG: sigma-70 family RNA polymerase sigma factor [Gemmatimonadota bacterium]